MNESSSILQGLTTGFQNMAAQMHAYEAFLSSAW